MAHGGCDRIAPGAVTVVEDERVDLRDYGTMQDLLDALAWTIGETVTNRYRSDWTQSAEAKNARLYA